MRDLFAPQPGIELRVKTDDKTLQHGREYRDVRHDDIEIERVSGAPRRILFNPELVIDWLNRCKNWTRDDSKITYANGARKVGKPGTRFSVSITGNDKPNYCRADIGDGCEFVFMGLSEDS